MDEYIKREEAIEAVKHAWDKGLEPSQYIEIIPAADVSQVRHGKWLHTEIEDDEEWGGIWHKWTCDNCGYSVGNNPNGTNYCPNCGAKMDGGAD